MALLVGFALYHTQDAAGDGPSQAKASFSSCYYITDDSGSIRNIVGSLCDINEHLANEGEDKNSLSSSGVLNTYEYDAFGNHTECEETVHNRFGYTGQQWDSVTSQYYLRARFYNPVIGRFIQEDSYLGDGLNLFAYCQNNPVVYWDPTGHEKQSSVCNLPKLLSNLVLLEVYRKNKKLNIEDLNIVEIDNEQLKYAWENPNTGDDIVTVEFSLSEKSLLEHNANGELALYLEHLTEQTLILNEMSLTQTEVLTEDLEFIRNIYQNKNSPDYKLAHDMVDDYRELANVHYNSLASAQNGHAPHALDTIAGGTANTFLEDRRNGYANSTMGSSWYHHYKEVQPGKVHQPVVIVKTKGKKVPLDEYLTNNNIVLDTSKTKVGNMI